MTFRRWVTAIVAVVVVATAGGGCGDDDGGGEAATTLGPTTTAVTTAPDITVPDTTTAPDTTAATTAPTTAIGADTTTTAAPLGDEPSFTADGVGGSGCAPGPGPLPDGWWFGFPATPVGAEVVSFDLACFLTGDAAAAAAAEAGGEVENDYWVVNDSEVRRDVPIADGAERRCVGALGGPDTGPCDDPGQLGTVFPVWLRVQAGEADRLVEQYLP